MGGGARFAKLLIIATVCTGFLGLALKTLIEKIFMKGMPHAEIEEIFKNLPLMAASLFTAGLLILVSGNRERRTYFSEPLTVGNSAWIGLVQGLCLPFRGFSRSGATISTGLLLGVPKLRAEEFSFALAVILTPPVIGRELLRLIKASGSPLTSSGVLSLSVVFPGLVGMCFQLRCRALCAPLVIDLDRAGPVETFWLLLHLLLAGGSHYLLHWPLRLLLE